MTVATAPQRRLKRRRRVRAKVRGSAERRTQISLPIHRAAFSRSTISGSVATMPLPCSRPWQPLISVSPSVDFSSQGW